MTKHSIHTKKSSLLKKAPAAIGFFMALILCFALFVSFVPKTQKAEASTSAATPSSLTVLGLNESKNINLSGLNLTGSSGVSWSGWQTARGTSVQNLYAPFDGKTTVITEDAGTFTAGNANNDIFVGGKLHITRSGKTYKATKFAGLGDWNVSELGGDHSEVVPFGKGDAVVKSNSVNINGQSYSGLTIRSFPYNGRAEVEVYVRLRVSEQVMKAIQDPMVGVRAQATVLGAAYDNDQTPFCDISLAWVDSGQERNTVRLASVALSGSPVSSEQVILDQYSKETWGASDDQHVFIKLSNFSSTIGKAITGGDDALGTWDSMVMTAQATTSEKITSGVGVNIGYINVTIESFIPENDISFVEHSTMDDVTVTDLTGLRFLRWRDGDGVWDIEQYRTGNQSYSVKYVKAGDIIVAEASLRVGDKYLFLTPDGYVEISQGTNTYTKSSLYRELMFTSTSQERLRLRNSIIDTAVYYLKKRGSANYAESQQNLDNIAAGIAVSYAGTENEWSSLWSTISSGYSNASYVAAAVPDAANWDATLLIANFTEYYHSWMRSRTLDSTPLIRWMFPEDYLEVISVEEYRDILGDPTWQRDLTGQTVVFRVKENVSEMQQAEMIIAPYLQYWSKEEFSAMGQVRGVTTNGMMLLLDSSAPQPVAFNETDNLYKNFITTQAYYVNDFKGDRTFYTYNGGQATRAGAFIKVKLASSVFTVSGSQQYIYYTTDGTNPADSTSRILLCTYTESGGTVSETPLILTQGASISDVTLWFRLNANSSMKKNTFILRFAVFDYVGNVSDISEVFYVNIDCSEYTIKALVKQIGVFDGEANTTQSRDYGQIYFRRWTGTAWTSWQRAGSYVVKRNDVVAIKIEVNKQSKYRMSQYYNNGTRNITNDNIIYGLWRRDNWGDFYSENPTRENDTADYYLTRDEEGRSVGVLMDDSMLTNLNNLIFTLVFKERLAITVGATEAVYDATEKTIGQPTVGTFSDILITTYYIKPQLDLNGNIIEPKYEDFTRTAPFTNAGTYYYYCVITDASYCGERMGQFIIHKANPLVSNLTLTSIIYEQSMAASDIRVKAIDPEDVSITYYNDRSSDGKVRGIYMITSPLSSSATYLSPSQGYHTVKVTFTPDPEFRDNYNTTIFDATLYVDYSRQLNIYWDEASFKYTYAEGIARRALATTNKPPQTLIYEYKLQGQRDEFFTTTPPINAGIYEVRVRTDLSVSNYDNQLTTVDSELKFIINRAEVNIYPIPVVCYYQYDIDPSATTFLKGVGGADGRSVAVNGWKYEYSVDGESWTSIRPVDAGVYQVKMTVDSVAPDGSYTGNFQGTAYTTLTIKKGNEDSASPSYSIIYPMLTSSGNAHLIYGQPLSSITYFQNSDYVARYSFRIQGDFYEKRIVPGRFFIANRYYDPIIDSGYEDYRVKMGALILNAGTYNQDRSLFNVFLPDDTVNFNISYQRETVNIAKATPDFSGVILNNLVYKDTAEKVVMPGYTKRFTVLNPESENPVNAVTYTIADLQTVGGQYVNPRANTIYLTGTFVYSSKFTALNAGTQGLLYSFMPDDLDNVRSVTVTLYVVVEKEELDMQLVSNLLDENGNMVMAYGTPYTNPTINCYDAENKLVPASSYRMVYTYTNSAGATVNISSVTPVGVYTMTATVEHNNFRGTLVKTIEISKVTPRMNIYPVVPVIYYRTNMSLVSLSGGRVIHPVTGQQIGGTFRLYDGEDYPLRNPETVGITVYKAEFVPADTANINSIVIDISVDVKKAHAEIYLTNLDFAYNGRQNMPTVTTNYVIRQISATETDRVLITPENPYNSSTDRYLQVKIYCEATVNREIPVNAGNYTIRAEIEDAYYEGVVEVSYRIRQVEAYIRVVEDSRVQIYDGSSKVVGCYVEDIYGERLSVSIAQSYTNYNNERMLTNPVDVGVYSVVMDIRDVNYRGTATSTLTIGVTDVVFTNTTLNYGENKEVTVSQVPFGAIAEITYRRHNPETDSYGPVLYAMPTASGTYMIIATYAASANMGYTEVFTSTLTINKAKVELIYNEDFSFNYTGNTNPNLASALLRIKMSVITLYTMKRTPEFGTPTGWTRTEPVDAGVYDMKVSIEDDNFEGYRIFTYRINPVSPVMDQAPSVQPLTYTDDGSQAVFYGGSVIFNGHAVYGSYSLMDSAETKGAGTHTMRYLFTPLNPETEERNGNFLTLTGTVSVTINKKDLSAFIVFSGNNIVEYNTKPHIITASVTSGENVLVEVYYEGLKTPRTERGKYTVSARISDKNYQGEAVWNKQLEIRVGIPSIVLPTLSPIIMSDRIAGVAVTTTTIQGGYAYITDTGVMNGGVFTQEPVKIGGVFEITDKTLILYKANIQMVEVTFKPHSPDFAAVTKQCAIKVIGEDPVIGTVTAQIIDPDREMYYGYRVGDYYSLAMINPPVGATPGYLSFKDPNYIPRVGEKVKYIFTPVDTDRYNIIEGEVEVSVNKAQAAPAPDTQVQARVYYGSTFSSAEFVAHLINEFNEQIPVTGTFRITEVEGFEDLNVILTLENTSSVQGFSMLTLFNAAGSGQTVLHGSFVFTSDNYDQVTGEVEIICYFRISENNITAGKISKQYDGNALTASDLNISVSGTDHPIFDEDITLTVYDNSGNIVSGAAVGIYTVLIEIADEKYYGAKTVTYTVGAKDISSLLTLTETSSVYGDNAAKPTIIINAGMEGLTGANARIEFKRVGEAAGSYNETMPASAGIYDVRVTVIGSDKYVGSAVLTYVIQKRAVALTVEPSIQYYGSVNPLNASVEDGLAQVTVHYYSPTYTKSPKVPTEVGEYTAVITVQDDNYRILSGGREYVEVGFTILQLSLILRDNDKPIASELAYGQKLKDAILTGGRVTLGESTVVRGEFSFVNGDFVPEANTREEMQLVFHPENRNYASVYTSIPVRVRRADAEIIFINLTATYNGSNLRNRLTYTTAVNAGWEIEFMQGGNPVEPVNAGLYYIKVRVTNPNYQLGVDSLNNPVLERESAVVFIVDKASVSSYTVPRATDISYGQSLSSSSLETSERYGYGVALYEGIGGYAAGSFVFTNKGLVLGNAGKYVVDIKFVPADPMNYNGFDAKVEITVNIAAATIRAENIEHVYGTPLPVPRFVTNPSNLSTMHNMDTIGQILDVGTYNYRVWITSPNYYDPSLPLEQNNYLEFTVTIKKKVVPIEFTLDGTVVEKYFTTYQKILFARAQVQPGSVLEKDLYSSTGLHINSRITINYCTSAGELLGDGRTPPSNIGDYMVIARLDDQYSNYTGEARIFYDVLLGVIESVSFDTATLEKQIYAGKNSSLVPPIVKTQPSGVHYYIEYQGHGQHMPTSVGTYSITVYFNDPNFEPKNVSAIFKIQKKEITLENIQVQSKVYDGTSSLDITAKMNGVAYGDEVILSIKARTVDGKVAVGKHYVDIYEYTISGHAAGNYYVSKPYFPNQIEIFDKKIADASGENFITSSKGFSSGITVSFTNVTSKQNQESFFSNIFGQKAMVTSIIIKDNSAPVVLDETIKVYIKIPDEYLNAKNLKLVGVGALADRQLNAKREGGYLTFYTDSSGDVIITSTDFNYWTIAVIGALAAVAAGIVFLFMLNPMHRRKSTANLAAEREYIRKARRGQRYED